MIGKALGRRLCAIRELIALSPLIVAIVVALSVWIALAVMPVLALLGWPIAILSLWAIANYFFDIVEFKARGRRGWPVLSIEAVSRAGRQKGVVFALVAAGVGGIYYFLLTLGWKEIAQIFAVLAALLIPASAALLAVTRSLALALDPKSLIGAAWGIGLPYLFVLGALALMLAITDIAISRQSIVAMFLSTYGFLLLAYLLGSLLYAKRRVLGIHAPRAPEVMAAAEKAELIRQRQSVIAHAYAFAGRGNNSGALAHIEEYARSEANALDARIWMFHEIAKWEDSAAALAYGERLTGQLEEAGMPDECKKVKTVCEYLQSRVRD